MNKKLVLALALVLVLATMVFVSADVVKGTVVGDADRIQFMKDRSIEQTAAIAQMLKDGKITADQAKVWTEHFTEMLKFHEDNGFLNCGMGNGGGRVMGFGQRGGRGMMNGFGTPPVLPATK